MKRYLVALTHIVLSHLCTESISTSFTSSWSVDSIKRACTNDIRICDPETHVEGEGGIIQSKDVLLLEERIEHLEETYFVECDDGSSINVQMSIVIVPSMSTQDLPHYYSLDDAVKMFASTLHNEWGVGNSCGRESSGILLFVSIKDRSMYVSTSNGVQSVLTTERLEYILDQKMKPYLKNGRYYKALETFVVSVEEYFESGPPSFLEQNAGLLILAGFLGIFGIVQWFQSRQRNEYQEVQEKLSKLDREKALLKMGQYKCTSCPICLEDFKSGTVEYNESEYGDERTPLNVTGDVIGSDGLPVRILRCGHAFDETCWKDWITKGRNSSDVTKCPVCKMDINEPRATTDTSTTHNDNVPPFPTPQPLRRRRSPTNYDVNRWYRAERNFRLTRMMARYPRYIRPSQIERWTDSNYQDRMVNDREFVRRNPTSTTERGAGSSSSNTSGGHNNYGGGHSSGGVGSSW